MAITRRRLGAPIDAVASVLADPRTYDGIVVGSRRIRWFDPTWPAKGSRFDHTIGFGPITILDHTEVLSEELPERLELAAGIRPLGVFRVEFRLAPDAGGTMVEVVEGPLSGPITRLWTPPADALTAKRNEVLLGRLDDLAKDRHRVRTLDRAPGPDAVQPA